MSDKPNRKFVVKAKAQGDTLEDAAKALEKLANQLRESSKCSGYYARTFHGSMEIKESPEVTAASFQKDMDKYLSRKHQLETSPEF